MTTAFLLISLIMACGDEEENVEAPIQEAVKEEVVKKEPVKDYASTIGLGQTEEMVTLLKNSGGSAQEKKEKHFYFAGILGATGGDRSVLSTPLDRTWAAWVAKDYAEVAAQASSIEDSDLQAGFTALAILQGAETPLRSMWEEEEAKKAEQNKKRKKDQEEVVIKEWSPAEALQLLMILEPTQGESFLEQAQTITSWSAKLALMEWATKHERPELVQYAEQAASFEGPQQAVLSLYRSKASKNTSVDPVKKALQTAVTKGDPLAGRMAVEQLVALYSQRGQFSQLWTDVSTVLDLDARLKKKKGSWESLEGARVALLAGEFDSGFRLSQKVLGSAQGSVQQEGLWFNIVMASQLRDREALDAAKETATEALTPWLDAFGRLADLREILDVTPLLNSSVSPEQFVQGTLTLASSCGLCIEKLVPTALEKAENRSDRLRLLMLQYDWANSSGQAKLASQVQAILGEEYAEQNLAFELSIRENGGVDGGLELGEKASAFEKIWVAIAKREEYKLTEEKDRALKGLASVSAFSKASEMSASTERYIDAVWQNTPYHRTGLLSVGTALDGSKGFDHGRYVKELVGQTDEKRTAAGVGLIEMERTVRMSAEKGFHNRSTLGRYAKGEDRALLLQTAKARIAVVEYWLGGKFPEKELLGLSEAEKKLIGEQDARDVYKNTVLSANAVREKFKTTSSVISYLDWNGEYYAAVISPGVAGVKKIGSVSQIHKLIGKHRAALADGIEKDRVDHFAGDDLRSAILLPALTEELSGVGKYLVIAPNEFLGFSLASMPEQRDGLRFLADIRKVGVGTSLDAVWSGIGFGTYNIDMLALNRPAVDTEWNHSTTDFRLQGLAINQDFSPEIGLAKIHFGEMSKILMGEDASLDKFLQHAETSRYIYLSEIPASPSGGFELVGGELTLSQIESMSLQATIVFLSPETDIDVQAARVEAFMKAGVQSVVVQSWALPTKEQREYVDNLFISLKRNDPLMIAMDKSRQKTIEAQSRGSNYVNNAAVWGSFTAFAKP